MVARRGNHFPASAWRPCARHPCVYVEKPLARTFYGELLMETREEIRRCDPDMGNQRHSGNNGPSSSRHWDGIIKDVGRYVYEQPRTGGWTKMTAEELPAGR